MAKQFPLQSILTLRARVEEQRRIDLAKEEIHLEQVRSQEDLAVQRLYAAQARLEELKIMSPVDPFAIIAVQHEIIRLNQELTVHRDMRLQTENQCRIARSLAVAASQQRIAIEHLRDIFHLQVKAEATRLENEELGELGLVRWQHQHPAA